jgi:alkanesulfonate monooxygenase SsuD/methylene tetrahydromethanopterin reductase-like flavin-dependent oxidoreductase (luciferase family)
MSMSMPAQRPFRFGLQLCGAPSREHWLARARQAEALGYATLLIQDHLDGNLAPIAALAAAAEATTTLGQPPKGDA